MWDWATPEALSARRDLDRQAQSDGQRQRPDLRLAGREHRPSCRCSIRSRTSPTTIKHPYRDPEDAVVARTLPRGPSAYWGDEPIWDGHTSIHNPMMDEQGRVWFTARIRPAANPDYCKAGSRSSFGEGRAAERLGAPALDVRSEDRQVDADRHLLHDASSLFRQTPTTRCGLSAGGPASGVVGWLDTKMFDETGDEQKSQGWTPLILDTNGNGKRDAYVEANQPLDPTKDKRVMAAFYGMQPSPVDGSIWGQSMDVGFSRIDQPGYIVRLTPGANPSETALVRSLSCRRSRLSARAASMSISTAWSGRCCRAAISRSFDRRKCKGPLNGPTAATGKHCPEGWTLYRMPGPQFKGRRPNPGSANHAYYVWVDRYNTLGLGDERADRRRPMAARRCSRSSNGKFVDLRIPYPHGLLQPRTSTAASTIRMPAGKAAASGRRPARARCSTAKAARKRARASSNCRCAPTRSRIDGGAGGGVDASRLRAGGSTRLRGATQKRKLALLGSGDSKDCCARDRR